MRAFARPLLLAAAVAVAACGTRGTLYSAALTPLPVVATASAVVQVVPQTNRAVIVKPGEPSPTAVRLSPGARLARRIPKADALVVLTGGPRAPTLDLLDVASRELQVLELPGYFDQVTFSEDGRFGVFTYDASSSSGPLVARNLNEVALFTTASRAVTRLQLDTESLAPRGVLFGPAEANRQLVAVTLERGVALFDALHPEVAPRRINIRAPGSTAETAVVEAVFSRDARWLFLRATALDDVIAVELGPEVNEPLSASLNFVAGGRGLADLEPAPEGYPDAVLAAYSTSRELWLLDARGILDNARSLSVDGAVTAVAALGGSRVVGWATGSRTVVAWDLADGRSGSAQLDGAIVQPPLLVPDLGRVGFFLPSTSSGPALSTVSVADEVNRLRLRLSSIQLSRVPQAWVVDLAGHRLFFAVSGSPTVVTVELSTLRLAEMVLDDQPLALHWLPDGDWLAADHGNATRLGHVTTWPAGSTERAGAQRFSDFAFTGDLDRPEEP
jgi:hypothetical protein